MRAAFLDELTTVYAGDCRRVLPRLPAASVDALVTDPPAGIGFRGIDWDRAPDRAAFIAFMTEVMAECRRVLRPGGYALVWAIPRTSHWTAISLEDAGFEVRDVITHIFGSGMPKSLDCGRFDPDWSGWGTALKPAGEHWILARSPLAETTVVDNLRRYGVGALHIDACRVPGEPSPSIDRRRSPGRYGEVSSFRDPAHRHDLALYGRERRGERMGRWPANLVLSHEQDCDDECLPACPVELIGQSARFFYAAKPSRLEREDAGPNPHPTVKSLALMRHLCALVTSPGGTVLDCFAGSGTTLVAARGLGFRSIGIESDRSYLPALIRRVRQSVGLQLERAA
ncbi:MAG: DNA-methyltransferase [Candidatus Limnocylindrales bacterium]